MLAQNKSERSLGQEALDEPGVNEFGRNASGISVPKNCTCHRNLASSFSKISLHFLHFSVIDAGSVHSSWCGQSQSFVLCSRAQKSLSFSKLCTPGLVYELSGEDLGISGALFNK